MAKTAETGPDVVIDPRSIPDESLYEVIDGKVVEPPPMGPFSGEVASILGG